jgi:hypothetical protein
VDSKITRNHIIPKVVKRLRLLYKVKGNLYILVTILRELVLYKNNIINLKIGPVQVSIKR